MIANQNGCRYACGLDHVILEGYALAQHEGSVTIDRINGLHRRIAEQVVLRAGPLSGKEICFLRKHLGLTPEELEDRINGGAGSVRLAEIISTPLPRESDVELRRLVFTHHDARIPSFAALYALYGSNPQEELVIRVRPEDSDIGWRHAA